MTATPIPRTLSLTLFGDLDMSVLTGLPPGRSPITTRVVPSDKSPQVYQYLAQRARLGEQAYIVVPTIDPAQLNSDSDSPLRESAAQLKDLQSHVRLIQETYCPDLVVQAVHGRLKPHQRHDIMSRFVAGQIHVLVATTVIEVGVDVPNATLMIVEHADRFGLAQLHQLRGRIGRGTHTKNNLCVFIADPTTPQAQDRLHAISQTTDGFKIAEADLEIRGMGDFFGTRQHGLPPLRIAQIPQNMDLLLLAKRDAEQIIASDPNLSLPHHQPLGRLLKQQYGPMLQIVDVG